MATTSRWIAWLLLVAALAATVALGWAAVAHPGSQNDIQGLLSPSSHLTATGVLLLWAAGFAAFAIPRRRQGRPFALLVIGGTALVSFLLGLASVAPCTNDEDDVLTPLWNTMVLFVGTTPAAFEAGGVCAGPVPLAAQLARFGAMAAVFGTAVALALTFAMRQWDRLWARFIRHDELVIGANPSSLPIIKTLLEWRKELSEDADRRVHIAILSLPGEEQTAQTVRDWGGRVHPIVIRTDQDPVVGGSLPPGPSRGVGASGTDHPSDAAGGNKQTIRSLRPFLTTRGRPAVTRVWILHDDLELALSIQESAREVLQHTRGPLWQRPRKWLYRAITGHEPDEWDAKDRALARFATKPVLRWVKDGAAPRREVSIVTLCEDRREAQRLRSQSITQESRPREAASPVGSSKSAGPTIAGTDERVWTEVIVDPVCPDEVSATEVVGRVAVEMSRTATPGYHLVICGDTALADALLHTIALRRWEQQRLDQAWQELEQETLEKAAKAAASTASAADPSADPIQRAEAGLQQLRIAFQDTCDPQDLLVAGMLPTSVVVVAPTAQALIDQWHQSAAPGVRAAIRPKAVPLDWIELTRDNLPEGALAVVLTESVDLTRTHLTERLNLRLKPDCAGMWVLSRHITKSCPRSFADHEHAFAGNVLLNGRLPEDYWMRMGRMQHEVFRRRNFAEGNFKRRPWWHRDDNLRLPLAPGVPWSRAGNLHQVRVFRRWLVQLGYRWVSIEPSADAWTPSDDLVEVLARLEQYRWDVEKRGDTSASLDPRVIPPDTIHELWEKTEKVDQEKTRGTIQANFELMQALGYIPARERPTGSGRA